MAPVTDPAKIRSHLLISAIILAVISTGFTEGKNLRYRRGTNELRESYIVHYNNKGEPLSVAGFDEFIRVLNGKQAAPGLSYSSYAENSPFSPPSPETTALKPTTTTEATTSHQPKPLATGTLTTPYSIVIATGSPEPVHVNVGSTESPLKVPREMSGIPALPEVPVSTDKPALTLALGHDTAGISSQSSGWSQSSVDAPNLVTPTEYSSSKTTASSLRFPSGAEFPSKVISLQPAARLQTVLNYVPPASTLAGIDSYVPSSQTVTYASPLTAGFQKTYAYSHQPEVLNYASYPGQNVPAGNVPLIVRQSPQLIDIGQGLGQGYGSAPQELAVNLGGWGGIEYGGQRSISQAKPVPGIAKFGYAVPVSSPALSKVFRNVFFAVLQKRMEKCVVGYQRKRLLCASLRVPERRSRCTCLHMA
ncbi:uncharacterized protein LOC124294976 [Neodiprion lecontei]|uniref:Uncharacterized protein LOC124294976 n=1 Tax=Neodiprion lecontei TaxID=441921 RepID=A0ABM3GEQ4_NEOLC|nr:uncharacterized protein LOC124294976 [Neodiprion lecontei]